MEALNRMDAQGHESEQLTRPLVDLGRGWFLRDGLQINLGSVGPTQAVGNTWNANVQGADNTGRYSPPVQKTGPASGTNYSIGNAGVLNL